MRQINSNRRRSARFCFIGPIMFAVKDLVGDGESIRLINHVHLVLFDDSNLCLASYFLVKIE